VKRSTTIASIDPTARALLAVPKPRFELKIHEIAPENIEPLGDRYVVEVIELDEKVQLGSLLVVTQQAAERPRDPLADPTVERRGVLAAVVIRAGNGHLLGLPDPRLVVREHIEAESADVPMFYSPGDVVLIDHSAKGRALKIVGRECRILNQLDCLARIEGIRLRRTDDGTWEQE